MKEIGNGFIAGALLVLLYIVLFSSLLNSEHAPEKNYIEFPTQRELDSLEMEELLKENL